METDRQKDMTKTSVWMTAGSEGASREFWTSAWPTSLTLRKGLPSGLEKPCRTEVLFPHSISHRRKPSVVLKSYREPATVNIPRKTPKTPQSARRIRTRASLSIHFSYFHPLAQWTQGSQHYDPRCSRAGLGPRQTGLVVWQHTYLQPCVLQSLVREMWH